MVVTFILGVAAGWGAPYAEPHIRKALGKALKDEIPGEPREMALISLAACVLGASILAMLIASSHSLPLALGVVGGALGPHLLRMWRASKTPDYDS